VPQGAARPAGKGDCVELTLNFWKMKKIIILAMIAVATSASFMGCEKNAKDNSCENCIRLNYEDYIINLAKETGIDVFSLSKNEEIKENTKDIKRVLSSIRQSVGTKDIYSETIAAVQNIYTDMHTFYNNGDYEQVLIMFDSLSVICMEINADLIYLGLQEYVVSPNIPTLYLPIPQMTEAATQANNILEVVKNEQPNFMNISPQQQQDVIAAVVYLTIKSDDGAKYFSQSDCEKRAANIRDRDLAIAASLYILGNGACVGSGVAVMACAAIVYAGYMTAIVTIQDRYQSHMQLCKLQGYF
jgi:hypothetical protein